MPTCVCLRTSMGLHLSVRRECVRIDFYAIGGGIWKRFSMAKTIKMLTLFCILSNAVSPLLCQRSEIWNLYLGMHITFSLKVCQNKCRFIDSFKKSRSESLGSVCSVCADGNIFWSYEENNHTVRYQHCFFPSHADFPRRYLSSMGKEPGRSKLDEKGFTKASSLMERRTWQPGRHHGSKKWLYELLTTLVGQEGEKSTWTSLLQLTSPHGPGLASEINPMFPKSHVLPKQCHQMFAEVHFTFKPWCQLHSHVWGICLAQCDFTAETIAHPQPKPRPERFRCMSIPRPTCFHPRITSCSTPQSPAPTSPYSWFEFCIVLASLSKEWDPDLWPPQLSNYGQGKSDEGKWDFFSPSRSANLTVREKLIGKDILPHTSWRKTVLWFRTGSRSEKQEDIFMVVSICKAYFYKLSERTSHVCWALTQVLWISHWPLISFSSPWHENSIF